MGTPRSPIAMLAAAFTLLACESQDDPAGPIDHLPRQLTVAETEVIRRSNAFGFDLLKEVHAREQGPNVFLSPLSASMALAMVLNGANGQTRDDLLMTLRFGGLTEEEINQSYRDLIALLIQLDPAVELGIANAIYAKEAYGLQPAFADRVAEFFDAVVRNVSFTDPATLDLINGWVEDRTRGRIDRILDEVPDNLAVLLLNAIYFDGAWTRRFDPSRTRDGSFHREDGSLVTVPLMLHERQDFPYAQTERYRAAELPYGGGAFRMVVIVPEGEHSLADLVQELDDVAWSELLAAMSVSDIDVLLPKFEIRYEELLNEPLIAMGMRQPFRTGADFGRMMPQVECLSFVLQKTYISVDEEGTTAAAVTAVGGIDSLPPGIYATRPFLFAIREAHSGTILFIGTIGDPAAAEPPAADPLPAGCPG